MLASLTRNDLLTMLPPGGEVAEIGVAKGEFSRLILDVVNPHKLHLIDPWEHQNRDDYLDDPNNVSETGHTQRYNKILLNFSAEIAAGKICVHRAYSSDAVGRFSDKQLDWVYIDGIHTYEGAYRDLCDYSPKIKENGFIIGHDYTNNMTATHWGFGVVEAVNRFVVEHNWTFLLLTWENYPTYVLTRDPGCYEARLLLTKLFKIAPYIVDLKDFPGGCTFTHPAYRIDDQYYVIPTFSRD
nr:class I SAM-dependent methyltransferase [Azospirillum oleiclasticum]